MGRIANKSRTIFPGDSTIPSNTVICQYDVRRNLAFKQDSQGKTDLFTYDMQDRELSHTQKKADGTEAITTGAGCDLNGKMQGLLLQQQSRKCLPIFLILCPHSFSAAPDSW